MMRTVKQAALAAALVCLMAPGAARAWAVTGAVVCGDSAVGVQGVQVTIGYWGHPDYTSYTGSTDATGIFSIPVPDALTDASVNLVFGTYTADYGPVPVSNYSIGSFSIPADWCAPPPPPPPPPPPTCPALEIIKEGAFCLSKPFGSPKAECSAFGLQPVASDDLQGGLSTPATTTASLALVKAGLCYNLYLGVTQGETLNAPYNQGISHVTYCNCPSE
jgi:hypothetical protein